MKMQNLGPVWIEEGGSESEEGQSRVELAKNRLILSQFSSTLLSLSLNPNKPLGSSQTQTIEHFVGL